MTSTPDDPKDSPGLDCWNRIGISGDQSCPELEVHIHCRNCPVFEAGARSFFDRPAPPGYLDEWARSLDADIVPHREKSLSLLIFRLRHEWLAFPTRSVVEVTATRPVHRIPHRTNEILVGMVNLRGRLQLQVSLHGLLGVDAAAPESASNDNPRLVVIQGDGPAWVFEADEVLGVPDEQDRGRLCGVPSTLANPANSFSQAVIDWDGRSVGVLDAPRVFAALKEVGR
jgi:chemotaxis-related protein WspD